MANNKFFNRKLRFGFHGLAALLLFYGFALAGCDNAAGILPDDETSDYASDRKTISIKFEVQNGGSGLDDSAGIVSDPDDTYLVCDSDVFANDFTITITVLASYPYLNIRWKGITVWLNEKTYLYAKTAVQGGGKYTIGIDFNGTGNVATTNLYDVHVTYNESEGQSSAPYLWSWAWSHAISDE